MWGGGGGGFRNGNGKFKKALEFYDKALKIRLAQLGEKHPQTGITHWSIADAYRNKRG